MTPDAEAQTAGMERRQDRREGRQTRREQRRTGTTGTTGATRGCRAVGCAEFNLSVISVKKVAVAFSRRVPRCFPLGGPSKVSYPCRFGMQCGPTTWVVLGMPTAEKIRRPLNEPPLSLYHR